MKLSQHVVDTLELPPGKDDFIAWDDTVPGLGLRLRKGGSRTWVFWYRVGRQRRKLPIGSAAVITAGEARKQAAILHAEAKLGGDPAGEKAAGKARADETVGAVLPIFLARQKERLRPRAYVEVVRHLNVGAKRLHRLTLADVNRRDVATVLAAIATAKSGATANRVRASLSSFFAWCIREGLLEVNPVAWTERREEISRDRVIADDELCDIWVSLKDDTYGSIVKLLILSGARREEIGALRWSEVDFDKALIKLPPERVKNGQERIMVLSVPALAILQERPRLAWPDGSPCDLVFGRGARGFSDWVGSKIDLDRRILARRSEPLKNWTLHDFRRLLSTAMHDQLRIQPHVVGHRRGVPGVYNRASYEREMRIALDLWAEHVLALVEQRESKVLSMSQRA